MRFIPDGAMMETILRDSSLMDPYQYIQQVRPDGEINKSNEKDIFREEDCFSCFIFFILTDKSLIMTIDCDSGPAPARSDPGHGDCVAGADNHILFRVRRQDW